MVRRHTVADDATPDRDIQDAPQHDEVVAFVRECQEDDDTPPDRDEAATPELVPEFGPGPRGLLATDRLLERRGRRVFGTVSDRLLRYLACVEVPPQVTIGRDLVVHHRAQGLVVHPRTSIGDRVHLFQNVTIGVGAYPIWEPTPDEQLGPIVVEDDVWLCSGATVLAGREELRIRRGTVVGAGAILRNSTRPWEIWAGVPARRLGGRRPTVWVPPHERHRHGDLIELGERR